MITLGIDPSGTTGCGYGVFDGVHVQAFDTDPQLNEARFVPDACAVEGPWAGPMGKVSMWGLGFDAAWRLCSVKADRKFILKPKEWRAQWPRLANGSLPGDVIVGRLRQDMVAAGYSTKDVVDLWTHDMVEAAGIAVALHRLLTTPGPKGKPWRPRKGCEVRR